MAQTLNDIVIIPFSKERDISAKYFAEKRILFEYPRQGYGPYDNSHIENIKNGILGELAFFEYVHNYLTKTYINETPQIISNC